MRPLFVVYVYVSMYILCIVYTYTYDIWLYTFYIEHLLFIIIAIGFGINIYYFSVAAFCILFRYIFIVCNACSMYTIGTSDTCLIHTYFGAWVLQTISLITILRSIPYRMLALKLFVISYLFVQSKNFCLPQSISETTGSFR